MSGDALVIVGMLLAGVAVGVISRLAMSRSRVPCVFCGEILVSLEDLDPTDRRQIMEYFADHEKRRPKESAVFACRGCRTVHDDFSGEQRSRDIDAVAGVVTNMTFCKVCNGLMRGCDLEASSILCRQCGTPYKWEIHGKGGWRFLAPPSTAPVLPECRDSFGVG